jgi:hypothetical protein
MKRAIAVVLLAAAALASCGRGDAGQDSCACAAEPVVDAALLAFLSKARAAHHQADLAQEDGNLDLAITALEPVVRGPRPKTATGELGPEVAEVLADTRARLADLRSDLGDFALALRDAADGLSLATRPTHFRGHLFEIQGVVFERQARALDAQGDTGGAARAKSAALDAFDAAIKIQDQVITDALSGDAGRPGR